MLLPFTPMQLLMVTYHRENDFKRCISALLKYTREPFNLAIIDNSCGGLDNALNTIVDDRVTIYKNKINLGKGRAFMKFYDDIMRQNTERYFISIDSDIEVSENWLTNLRREASKIDDFAILAPVITDGRSFEEQLRTSLTMHCKDENSRFITDTVYANRQTAGPLLIIDREFFESAGGYSQTQLYGNDDGELCLAAARRNLFVGITANVEVTHLESDVTDGYRQWKARNVHGNIDGYGYWDQ